MTDIKKFVTNPQPRFLPASKNTSPKKKLSEEEKERVISEVVEIIREGQRLREEEGNVTGTPHAAFL
ncbi:MAG TPA: hypothetical protein VD999_03140 [Vitreimonas sp.]|nr:hypothetical protein [Vitreimonas sp.]